MWGTSSSSFVGVNRDSETTLQSIGHYIENYIDLVENVPNEIIRGITQLHEKNHLYHQTLERLETAINSACLSDISEEKRKHSLLLTYKYLIGIQNLSDDKLYIMQSVYEQLEYKSRQLDHGIRAITLGSGGSNIFSPMKGSRDANDSGSEESQDSQDTQENENESSKNDNNIEATTNNHASGRRKKRKNANDDDDNEENDADNELPAKEQEKGTAKNRRGGRSGPSGRGGRTGGAGDHDKDHDHDARGGRKRGGRGHRGGSRGDRKRSKFDDEPSTLYDEPSPLDPDEPTYCICQQVSYGEMIGCDNTRCPIEWFHFSCVQLTNKPKGKWYCPQCRGDRSNIQRK